jgi:hypothetical protein
LFLFFLFSLMHLKITGNRRPPGINSKKQFSQGDPRLKFIPPVTFFFSSFFHFFFLFLKNIHSNSSIREFTLPRILASEALRHFASIHLVNKLLFLN